MYIYYLPKVYVNTILFEINGFKGLSSVDNAKMTGCIKVPVQKTPLHVLQHSLPLYVYIIDWYTLIFSPLSGMYINTYQSSLPFLRVWVFDCGEFRIWFNLDEKNKQLLSHLLSNQEKALSQYNGRKLKMRITCLFLHWYWFYKSKTLAGFLHILIAHPMHPCVGKLHRTTLILLSVFNV